LVGRNTSTLGEQLLSLHNDDFMNLNDVRAEVEAAVARQNSGMHSSQADDLPEVWQQFAGKWARSQPAA
jgi:hypothetical protein